MPPCACRSSPAFATQAALQVLLDALAEALAASRGTTLFNRLTMLAATMHQVMGDVARWLAAEYAEAKGELPSPLPQRSPDVLHPPCMAWLQRAHVLMVPQV